MNYLHYLRAVRKYWWMVLLAVVIAMGASVYLTLATEKKYETVVTFFVQTPSDQLSLAAQGDAFGQKRVNSYVQLTNTDRLLKPVLADTRLDMTTGALSQELSASGDLNTVLLTVTVTDPSAARSQLIAASVAKQFVKVVAELEGASGTAGSTVRLELVSGPTFNPIPVTPRPLLNYTLAALVGLIIGIGAAVLREVLDTTIRSSRDLERSSGASVIGSISYDETARKYPLIIDSHAQSVRAEAFRQLRTNLEFVNVGNPAKTIVISSSVPDEGKSSTATNLAVIFAEAGKLVLLIEADLRRPRVAEYLGIEGAVGLTNLLAGQVSLGEVLQPWGRGGLTVLPSGSIPPNPSEMLGSAAMVHLLTELQSQFDVILIDTPPLLPVTDAAILAAHADGAILVARYGRTTRNQVAAAHTALTRVDAKILGSVLNMAPMNGPESYGYGYRYYEESSRGKLDADLSVPIPIPEQTSEVAPKHQEASEQRPLQPAMQIKWE